jgi:hypothetical protein
MGLFTGFHRQVNSTISLKSSHVCFICQFTTDRFDDQEGAKMEIHRFGSLRVRSESTIDSVRHKSEAGVGAIFANSRFGVIL